MITILTKHKYYTILYVDIYTIPYRYTVTYMYTQNAYNYNLYTIFRPFSSNQYEKTHN